MTKRAFILFLLFAVMAPLAAFTAVSCTSLRHSAGPSPAVTSGTEGVAAVAAHTQSAEQNVQAANPHADDTGKTYLIAASREHGAVLTAADGVRSSLQSAQKEITGLQDDVAQRDAKYAKLESRWFVRWGRWIERIFWILLIGYVVTGAASVVLGLGNPLGWAYSIGREITHLVPLMNVFSWIRDGIVRWRSGSSTVSATVSTDPAATASQAAAVAAGAAK